MEEGNAPSPGNARSVSNNCSVSPIPPNIFVLCEIYDWNRASLEPRGSDMFSGRLLLDDGRGSCSDDEAARVLEEPNISVLRTSLRSHSSVGGTRPPLSCCFGH